MIPNREGGRSSAPGGPTSRLARAPARPSRTWLALLGVFWTTSMVEALGISQVFAFLPKYLLDMGVPEGDRLAFVGVFSSLIFVVGAPLVPLWGVWADKYSRKAVIVRSAVVEAVVFSAVALSREPWQVALSMLLIGLQLGNTGVMLAGIRDVTPNRYLGRAIALFGASGPIGFAVGPTLGGIIVDRLGLGLPAMFAVSAGLSIGTALLVAFGTAEVRPEVVPEGPVLKLAFGAIRGVLTDPATVRIFAIFGTSFLANQMARPYLPVLVEQTEGAGVGLASRIALVTGTAALAGALVSPLGGWLGDRIGFRPVLAGALLGGAVALALMPAATSVIALAGASLAFAAMNAAVSAMVFGVVATEVPAERRSATLNLVYLPLYAAGVIGPTAGALVVAAVGVSGPFVVAAAVFVVGAVVVALARGTAAERQAGRSRSSGPE
ncbi:MAG TPA: MFS transporter [Candidatus Limnocylindrales bacterium]